MNYAESQAEYMAEVKARAGDYRARFIDKGVRLYRDVLKYRNRTQPLMVVQKGKE